MYPEQKGELKKDYLILLFSAFFIYTYNNVFMMLTPLLLVRMGGTEMIAGLQATLFLIMAIILRFFFGPFADIHGKRVVMLLGSGSFLLAGILVLYTTEVWQIIALRLIQAIGLASYFPAASGIAATCAGSDKKGTYIGVLRMVASLSLMFGPVMALYFIQNYDYFFCLKSMAFFAFVGMLAVLFISPKVDEIVAGRLDEKDKSLRQKFNFWSLLQRSPLIVGTTFVVALSYGILLSFAALFIGNHTDVINPGFFFTVFSLGGIFANIFFGWLSDRYGRLRLMSCTLVSLGSGLLLFALLPRVSFLFYPSGFFAGIGYYGSIAILMAWMTEKVKPQECTAGLSLQQNALDLGIAVGSGLFGVLLVTVSNVSLLYGVLGILYLCYGMFCTTRSKA